MTAKLLQKQQDPVDQVRDIKVGERLEPGAIGLVLPGAAVAGVSGLYAWQQAGEVPFSRAELRLDVDGTFPLQVVSGSEFAGLSQRVDWIARPVTVQAVHGGMVWTAPITYRNGDTFLFQYTAVRIERNGQMLRLTLKGGGPDL